jgi:aminoglycoside phosphotransferase
MFVRSFIHHNIHHRERGGDRLERLVDLARNAIATWSTEWNYGQGWEDAVLSAYGVRPDPEFTAYYRLLWDLAL